MKTIEPSQLALWDGELVKCIGSSDRPQKYLMRMEHLKCPHCRGELPYTGMQNQRVFGVIEDSPLFQESIVSVPKYMTELGGEL